MKKYLLTLFLMISLFVFAPYMVSAQDYNGTIGYEPSGDKYIFYYYTEQTDASVTLNIYSGTDVVNAEMSKENGVFISLQSVAVGDEYNYTVCNAGGSDCKTVVDPFSPYLNNDGDANVILDISDAVTEFSKLSTLSVPAYQKSIYALNPEKFVSNITPDNAGEFGYSIFDKMIAPASVGGRVVGVQYLKNSDYKYIEMSNLYNDKYYSNINPLYSNMTNENSAINEYQAMMTLYKTYKLNVILKTNFVNVSPELAASLNAISPSAVVDGKLNFNNHITKRYIKDVYVRWVKDYKIDGFYIEDSELYGADFLQEIITLIQNQDTGAFIYTNSATKGYKVSNKIQELLYGSLDSFDNKGILTNDPSEETLAELYKAMFSGYYGNPSEYNKSVYTINNFGSDNGLDIYSKVKGALGMASNNSEVANKMKMGLYIMYASAGVPRVVAGNEFLNTNISDGVGIDDADKACISTNICYLKGDLKNINWESLRDNGTLVDVLANYRTTYYYQYPSAFTLENAARITVDRELLKKGVIYLTFGYNATANGEMERSLFIINLSDVEVEMPKISDHQYGSVSPLIGRITAAEDTTSIATLTFYTFTEIRNITLPQWVYIAVALCLVGIIIGTKALFTYLLKKKRGINYADIKPEGGWKLKKNKSAPKTKQQDDSIFETFLFDDPLIKERKELRKAEKEKRKAEKQKAKEEQDNNKKEGE